MAGQLLRAKAGICAQKDGDMERAGGRGVDICSQGLTNARMAGEERNRGSWEQDFLNRRQGCASVRENAEQTQRYM